jgi:1,4-dihydroxy-2-naphthoyl-CoA synthase
MAIKMLKFAMNLTDEMVGTTGFAGEATRLAYMTEEEGRNAFLKRKPNFEKKWLPRAFKA